MPARDAPAGTNSIRSISLRDHRLDPAEAEIRITVCPDTLSPTTEIRGRFVGPRCAGHSTLEVAYPLRPTPSDAEAANAISARVIGADSCFWTPESPYVYEGKVELWQERQSCDVRSISLRLGKTQPNP